MSSTSHRSPPHKAILSFVEMPQINSPNVLPMPMVLPCNLHITLGTPSPPPRAEISLSPSMMNQAILEQLPHSPLQMPAALQLLLLMTQKQVQLALLSKSNKVVPPNSRFQNLVRSQPAEILSPLEPARLLQLMD